MPKLSPIPTVERLCILARKPKLTALEFGEVGSIGVNKIGEARIEFNEKIRSERPKEYIHTHLFNTKDVFEFFGYDFYYYLGGNNDDANV